LKEAPKTMERKIEKEHIDHGFGFPIILRNVPMVKIRGEWTLDINYERYEETMILAMPLKPFRLTGSEIRFIRLHFGFTLHQFAQRFGLTRQAVMKWEKRGQQATNMNWPTEKDIRLFILKEKKVKPQAFSKAYDSLVEKPKAQAQVVQLPYRRIARKSGRFVTA
jgi:transcriptional regulator with XRE-family HTH domain